MGKVFTNDREPKKLKRRRRSKGSGGKYLKPGALAQLRCSKGSVAKSCTDLGRKRVAVLDAGKAKRNGVLEDKVSDRSPLMLSPVKLVMHINHIGTSNIIIHVSYTNLRSNKTTIQIYYECIGL